MQTQHSHNDRHFSMSEPRLSNRQFESLKAQLKLLTPSQLRSLQGEIDENLSPGNSPLLTHEELDAIASLF
ncbi:hypothetical protein [Vibrio mangrovi]|uniref:Uncharacterized protein n=1 Tax=Vibrio mangrovi TaxID=474394 RepID=A0A1Y6IVM2_9VIBR|nr:hypothetical protein [Vibrio mangrovi]MDW6004572.1 hypothetical protein [Vibrio mangrovi]SMS00860.1 hypothetical protein VIM7927_02131 [Vibrio mangrovi]